MLTRTSSSFHGVPTATRTPVTRSRSRSSQASPTSTTGTDLPLAVIAFLRRERQRFDSLPPALPVLHYTEALTSPHPDGSTSGRQSGRQGSHASPTGWNEPVFGVSRQVLKQ